MIHKPLRIEFDNDSDFFEAGIQYLQQVKEVALADIRQIDRASNNGRTVRKIYNLRTGVQSTLTTVEPRVTLTPAAQRSKNVFTIHDWLQKHPHLIERYKKIGAAALLEI